MPSIYKHKIPEQIQTYYSSSLLDFETSVCKYLDMLSSLLFEGLNKKEEVLYSELNNYHPSFIGKTLAELKNETFTLNDCKQCIASEHGFKNWYQVEKLKNIGFDKDFELAVQLILEGQTEELTQLLHEKPALVNQRSPFGHQATLLHYCGSNGVEFWRQQVPENLIEIIQVLTTKGADKCAKMYVYGGEFTTYDLFTSSAHPQSLASYDDCCKLLST